MAQPYVGEIRLFAGNFAPAGWNFCDGSLLPIADYETLFNVIGTTFGGDGQTTFAMPDLRGRVPLHLGAAYPLGQVGGVEQVTLTVSQVPGHQHGLLATANTANATAPAAAALLAAAANSTITPYGTDAPHTSLSAGSVGSTGGSQPHDNFQPYLCVSFIISLFGIFPSQV
jgi:microcystin-dependent protein